MPFPLTMSREKLAFQLLPMKRWERTSVSDTLRASKKHQMEDGASFCFVHNSLHICARNPAPKPFERGRILLHNGFGAD